MINADCMITSKTNEGQGDWMAAFTAATTA